MFHIPDTETKLKLLTGLFCLAILAGCGGDVQSSMPTSTPTVIPTETAAPTPTPEPAGPTILVPALDVPPPTLDGTILPEEWDQAKATLFDNGSELLLMRSGETLYLAIRASNPGIITGNVYLLQGNEVSILHSSAALGTAKYQKGEEGWELIQNFSWRCRSTGFGEAALAERAAFLEEEGWLAGNARMGTPNEQEYRISIGEDLSALAVIYLQGSDLTVYSYPADLADDSMQPFPGGIPEQMQLNTELWARIELIDN